VAVAAVIVLFTESAEPPIMRATESPPEVTKANHSAAAAATTKAMLSRIVKFHDMPGYITVAAPLRRMNCAVPKSNSTSYAAATIEV
jgi:hypothetical protein